MKLATTEQTDMLDCVILKSVVDWGINDKQGKQLPVDKDILDQLEADFVNELAQEILKLNNITGDVEKNFAGPSKQA